MLNERRFSFEHRTFNNINKCKLFINVNRTFKQFISSLQILLDIRQPNFLSINKP